MLRNSFLFYFLFFSLSIAAQQNYNSKNLVVSAADVENKKYPKDSTANAFYIFEKGYSRVENGRNYNLLTDYEAKIKILNERGYKKATIEILLYKDKDRKERVKDLIAYTHTLENGKIVKTKLEEKNIYTEKYDKNFSIIKFTFPKLKAGSVLTYKYQLESPFMYKFNGWNFQDDIPKIHSEFKADLPGNYIYNVRLVGPLKINSRDEKLIKQCLKVPGGGHSDCSRNVYVMKDIPAFITEKYMTAKENYLSRIDYELKEYKGFDGSNKKYTETWKSVDNKLKKEPTIGIQLKKVGATKDLLPNDLQALPNDLKKAKAIYQFITKNYTWNKKNDIFRLGNIKEVIQNKVGNVSGINILLHNTLKQQRFEVFPVLLSTRDNGYATKLHPVIADFNYLIVQLRLEGKTYLLDATEKFLAFGEVPFRCLNQYGRLLDFSKGSKWVEIQPQRHSTCFFKEKLTLNDDLTIVGNSTRAYFGYHASRKRKNDLQKGIENALAKLKKRHQNINASNINIKNQNNTEKPYQENFDFVNGIEKIEDLIYISPFTEVFFSENPFKLNERTFPVDFGFKDSYSYQVSIDIPENYEFVDIPKNVAYAIPNKMGMVSINSQKNGKNLILNHRILFNSPYYPIEYYSILKEFFNLIVKIEKDTVITVKKIS